MPKINLFAPENEAKSSGGSFKEGHVRVLESEFAVFKQGGAGSILAPVVGLRWKVERLDEEQNVLTDDDGNPAIESLLFSAGGSSLPKAHPGNGDNPEDEEVSDLGSEIGTIGNTLFLVDESFRINEKSSLAWLNRSLRKAGWKDEYARVWAPDYIGAVFIMGSEADEKNTMPRTRTDKVTGKETTKDEAITYKVVKKIVKTPYGGKAKAGKDAGSASSAAGTKTAAKPAAKPEEVEALKIIQKIASSKAGETLTFKLLSSTANNTLPKEFEPKSLIIPVVGLFKNSAWVKKTAAKLGYEVELDDDDVVLSITFPGGEEEADSNTSDEATD